MNTKPIDAVTMVRQIRDAMYEETKDISSEELIAYIRQSAAKATAPSREEESIAAGGASDPAGATPSN